MLKKIEFKNFSNEIMPSFEEVKEYIENIDGYKLLSSEYINNETKISIKCPENHEYEIMFYTFKRGSRCKKCYYNKKKLLYKDVKKYIENVGYKLISTEYINNNTHLNLICDKQHEIKITFNNFKMGTRCKECYLNNKTLLYKEVKNYIESFNYKLISTEYINSITHLDLICNNNHEIKIAYNNFKTGYRCKYCNIDNMSKKYRHLYHYVKTYLEEINYKLISKEYINSNLKIQLICNNNHEIEMSFDSIKSGSRCNDCRYINGGNESYKFKEYKLPSGKIIKYQGYEHFAIDILLKKYNENEIDIHPNLIIKYNFDDKIKNHYPDIFIPKDNLIIEVKSTWTYNTKYKLNNENHELNKNKEKQKASKLLGYKYEFWIISDKGNILEIID